MSQSKAGPLRAGICAALQKGPACVLWRGPDQASTKAIESTFAVVCHFARGESKVAHYHLDRTDFGAAVLNSKFRLCLLQRVGT